MTIELKTARQTVKQRAIAEHRVPAAGVKPSRAQILNQRSAVEQPAVFAEPVKRDTISTLPSPTGRFGLFDRCTDQDVLSLSFQGSDMLMDWLGARLTNQYTVKRSFIAWQRAAYSSGSVTSGWVSDPCADPAGVDYGVCDFTLTDFARLRRGGPTRDATENEMNYCITQPRFRIDGSQIMNVDEYDAVLAMESILGDLRTMLINGNSGTSGQFNGFQRLIKTGYTNSNGDACPLMDSQVINWNNNTFAGGSGITYNGGAVASTYSLIDALLFAYRTIKQRIMATPMLASQANRAGDVILVMPNYLTRCLLDAFACWSVCAGRQYNETNLNTYEARQFRNSLNGGMFGSGYITLDGDIIPLMSYDYGTMTGGVIQLTSLTESSTTVTATTRYAHGLTTGDSVTVSGATDSKYNLTATVTVTGATTFTYTAASGATSPDVGTASIVTIPTKGDIYMLTGQIGNQKLMELELLDLNGATQVEVADTQYYAALDGGKYLTWLRHAHTCYTRFLEMRPRLLSWTPWANARIQNVSCSQFGPTISMSPYSAAFPQKNFITAH